MKEQMKKEDSKQGREAYACVCCGELTMDERPPGTHQICPVCGWEDDRAQYKDPDYAGGANRYSLNEAKKQYKVRKGSFGYERT